MKYYAIIDTNVLVSALLSRNENAATAEIYRRIDFDEIIPVYSAAVMAEYEDVLHRAKFCFAEDAVRFILDEIVTRGKLVEASEEGIILDDMGDVPFYAIVMDGAAEYLVTGNKKHFPVADNIVTPREMLEIMDRG